MSRLCSVLALLWLGASCSSVPVVKDWVQWTGSHTAPLQELEAPGYFDIGMGFGLFSDDPLDDTQSTGVLLSVKAYPTGRWFSKRKSSGDNALVQASKLAAARNLLAKRVPDEKALQSPEAAAYAHGVLAVDAVNLRNEFKSGKQDALTGIGKSLRQFQSAAGKKQRDAAVKGPVVEALDGFDQDAVVAWVYDYAEASDFKTAGKWKQSTAHISAASAKTLYGEISKEATKSITLTASQAFTLTPEYQMLSEAESRDWVVAQERSQWYHRLSVFYGYTLDELEGSIQDHLHVVGVGYDVAPQFSLLAGFGFHSDDGMGGMPGDASSGLFLGTSLNLSTFKSGFSSLLGVE